MFCMVVSSLGELNDKDLDGDKVAVGFRPSGSLHVGNLLTLSYAAVLADELVWSWIYVFVILMECSYSQ